MNSTNASKKIKICLVAISLGRGGAERSTALLSKLLFNKGYEVNLVVLTDVINYEYDGNLFNLGKYKKGNDNLLKRVKRFKRLKAYFKESQFDYIIDNRPRNSALKELFYLKYIYTSQKLIYVIRNFNIDNYLPKCVWPFSDFMIDLIINRVYKLVGVSKAIAQEVNTKFSTEKTVAIYNPIEDLSLIGGNKSFADNYILYLGRIEEKSKNISLLLESYKISKLVGYGIKLRIVGSGPDEEIIDKKIEVLNLENNVERIAFTLDVHSYIKHAKFITLTSNYEGFPRVLIEALSLGTPVVSVNCKSGPLEIIKNRENGLLVDSYDENDFANAMNEMIENKNLYAKCKENARQSVSHLEQNVIAEEWSKILI